MQESKATNRKELQEEEQLLEFFLIFPRSKAMEKETTSFFFQVRALDHLLGIEDQRDMEDSWDLW